MNARFQLKSGTRAVSLFILLCSLLTATLSYATDTLTVYSSRKTHLIKPLLDTFSAQQKVKVDLLTAKPKALIARLKAEGNKTSADLLLTVDAGNLYAAKQAKLLQPVNSKKLRSLVPQHLRDSDGYWYALSKRFRVIVYAKDRVKPQDVAQYASLGSPSFKGKVCMRSSSNIYNQSLLASLIAHQGEAQALQWAKSVVNNFARAPLGNDRAQIVDIANTVCDVSLVNTYYVGIMQTNKKNARQQAAVKTVGIVFPNQKTTGAHVNVSGIGVIAASKKTALAQQLIEFLLSQESQRWYAEHNFEYPVRTDVSTSRLVKKFGASIKEDALDINKLGTYNRDAVITFDKAGWR